MTDYNSNIEQLVKKAQLGDKNCLEQLVSLAEQRLRADIYRLTFENDLTSEIVQEAIAEMIKIFGQLKDPQRFWPWLYKIAINKFRLYQRKQFLHKTVPISDIEPVSDSKDVLSNLIGDELKQTIFDALRRLKPEHRAVITMRCYREMDYNMIAESLGCSKFAAKMLFFRAKKAVAKQLSRRGLGRGSLMIALALFGKMTAESKAAAAGLSVTSASVKVGIPISVAGALLSTPGILTVSTIGLVTIGTTMMPHQSDEQIPSAQQQFVQVLPSAIGQNEDSAQQQCWYYYPQGPAGPVMIRIVKKDASGKNSYYTLRQNEEGNYQFDEKSNTIYIRNYRWWNSDFSVRCLPTDPPDLRSFLSKIGDTKYVTQYVPYNRNDLLVIATDGEGTADKPAIITYQKHLLEEEYFQYNLPVGAELVDQRDAMHKRGWTYFSVTGEINGQTVRGGGRIPFVYATYRDYSPWLKLSIGDDLQVIDTGQKAAIFSHESKTTLTCSSGEFFRGLSRPWMGLHTIDIVRRDAAEKLLTFETKRTNDASFAEVTIVSGILRLVYTIDMHNDLVNKIDLFSNDSSVGQLVFSYTQDIELISDFAEPVLPAASVTQVNEAPGILWLFQLAQSKLGGQIH